MAYHELHPFSHEIPMFMMAQLSALTANMNGGKARVEDFMPIKKEKKSVSVIDKIKAIFP